MKISAGCSTVGSALRSGRRGRKFESSHPDKKTDSFWESVFLYVMMVKIKGIRRRS